MISKTANFQLPPRSQLPFAARSICEDAHDLVLQYLASLLESQQPDFHPNTLAKGSLGAIIEELQCYRAEIDGIDHQLYLKAIEGEVFRQAVASTRSSVEELHKRRGKALNRANAVAARRRRLQLPLEIVSHICTLAYGEFDSCGLHTQHSLPFNHPPNTLWAEMAWKVVPHQIDIKANTWPRQRIFDCAPVKIIANVGYVFGGKYDHLDPVLEHRARLLGLRVHAAGMEGMLQVLRKCETVLPLLSNLHIDEESYFADRGNALPSLWWDPSRLETQVNPIITTAYVPISFVALSGGLFKNLLQLTVDISYWSGDCFNLVHVFIGMDNLRKLKVLSTDTKALPKIHDMSPTGRSFSNSEHFLPSLEDLTVDIDIFPHASGVLSSFYPCRQLVKLAVGYHASTKEGEEDPECLVKDVLDLICIADEHFPALTDLSLVGGRQKPTSVSQYRATCAVLRKLSKQVHIDRWMFPSLSSMTLAYSSDGEFMTCLLELIRSRRQCLLTQSVECLRLEQGGLNALEAHIQALSFQVPRLFVRNN